MNSADAYNALLGRLRELGSVLVAYSGGVDSTLLAVAAHAALGDDCKAVLATSDTYPESEAQAARDLAHSLGLTLIEVETFEMSDPSFAANPPDRCYHCKVELFGLLTHIAEVNGLDHIADGSNADDLTDHRPGAIAARELGVKSPLQDVGMTKQMIRETARQLGLPNWDKPSMACLASRFPYGEVITDVGVARVSTTEDALRELGLKQTRVRSHGLLARIEVAPDEMDSAWGQREAITDVAREAGFTWVALDTSGYRTGSLNESLQD